MFVNKKLLLEEINKQPEHVNLVEVANNLNINLYDLYYSNDILRTIEYRDGEDRVWAGVSSENEAFIKENPIEVTRFIINEELAFFEDVIEVDLLYKTLNRVFSMKNLRRCVLGGAE